jgi:hypothetical protein
MIGVWQDGITTRADITAESGYMPTEIATMKPG